MHAFLIIRGTQKDRQEKIESLCREWKTASFDRVTLERGEEQSIGIEKLREFTRRLGLLPFRGNVTAGIIIQAESLTTAAQHALLKTLEEPPAHSRIILETQEEHTLLPTILSRCQIIKLNSEKIETSSKFFEDIQKIQEAAIGKKLLFVDEIAKTKGDALLWVDGAIAGTRARLLAGEHHTALLRKLLLARRQLWANVNPKLVLDTLLF